jgi:acylglycerol lipase
MEEGSFEGIGGLKIHTRAWKPEGAPRAVVVISHGFNSHSGHYEWAGERLASHGLAVYALDHRGRGRSEGERFYVEHISEYIGDLSTFIDSARAAHPGLKVFLLGHSAGGVIACSYCLDHPTGVDGLICESFAFQVPAPDIALAILKGISHIAPHVHVLKLHNEDFSRDPAWVEMMNTDPLIENEVQPTLTVAAMVRADERLKESFGEIKLPVLILHGTEDKATKPSGSQEFYDHAGSADKTLKLYEGYVHDLLADTGKEKVMADIQDWIDARA